MLFPSQVLAGFAKIAQDVVSVERTGSEELLLNGDYVPCEILKVTYFSINLRESSSTSGHILDQPYEQIDPEEDPCFLR